ncbi:hypothetical protein [Paucilactobacillus kaifaensis]|uniref:hypothetical protein n=1 Tax=Paucilactobacillus kaifaensis TaxID=2559921 RepID=UPI0014857F61|nr:hypothetical protein [Paucilactobacillus kaifaensis]
MSFADSDTAQTADNTSNVVNENVSSNDASQNSVKLSAQKTGATINATDTVTSAANNTAATLQTATC